MRNLNGRFLILVGEGSLDWGRGYYLVVTWTTVLHEQRVMTGQELRAKAQFLCLKSVMPMVAALCAFWTSTQASWPGL